MTGYELINEINFLNKQTIKNNGTLFLKSPIMVEISVKNHVSDSYAVEVIGVYVDNGVVKLITE